MPGECGSGTDDRVGCGISVLGELKEQLVRHSAGGICLEAGGWVRWLRTSQFQGSVFQHLLPPQLPASTPPPWPSLSRHINKCLQPGFYLTPSTGSPCLHGPGSFLLEGFFICLNPCLNTSRSECFWSLVVFPKTLPFLFKPSRQISLPIPSKAI